jgi:ATP-dependent DNA helicase RecG
MRLDTPIQQISSIGPFYQKKLNKLGIKNVEDLLFHFPNKYDDFSNFISISEIKEGEKCSVKAKVIKIENKRIFKRKMVITQATIADQSGKMKAVWFNQSYILKNIEEDQVFLFSGKVTRKGAGLFFNNPLYQKDYSNQNSGEIVSLYPETRGLSSKWLRYLIKKVLPLVQSEIKEFLPEEIMKKNDIMPIKQALKEIHFPTNDALAVKAKKRFSFEKIFLIQLAVLIERARLAKEKSFSVSPDIERVKRFVDSLPYNLTDAQKKSAWQILKDIEKSYPMNRLLEGDVGSGKTVVATIAILNVIKAGFQASLMAPTEILAKQHFNEIFKLIKKFNVNVGLLTGKQDRYYSKKLHNDFIEISRTKLISKTKNGEIDLLIGTHALIQDKVRFKSLALVILDEQHRFGINQRAKLVAKDDQVKPKIPHLLSMTATPIPRTLALTVYGDLDISLIDELPKGRKEIITKIVKLSERKETYQFIEKEIEKGRQAFVICPRIEPSEEGAKETKWSKAKAVKEEYEKLSKEIFPNLSIGLIHGKMKPQEKELVMRDFKNKKTDILVSTSVVEVGIDIPNASAMIIEGAERFGLAQLHQLRGRVGRGKFQSYCFLFPESRSIKTKKRLEALVSCNDGFTLSEKDLALRGPGDFVGVRQWGVPDTVMDALRDLSLVQESKEAARSLLGKDSSLRKNTLLVKKVQELRKEIHLE